MLIDGLSCQSAEKAKKLDCFAKEGLHQPFAIELLSFSASSIYRDSRLPNTFDDATQQRAWRDAIDTEYSALCKQKTWSYVKRALEMNLLPITWVFRLKPWSRVSIQVPLMCPQRPPCRVCQLRFSCNRWSRRISRSLSPFAGLCSLLELTRRRMKCYKRVLKRKNRFQLLYSVAN